MSRAVVRFVGSAIFLAVLVAGALILARLSFAQNLQSSLQASSPQTTSPPATAAQAGKTRDYSFKVLGPEVWTDTGLDLQRGDLVHIYGGVIACGVSPSENSTLPLPSAPAGTLLAKIHLEEKPVSATPDAQFPIIAPSHLYLGINRIHCPGSLVAKVQVRSAPSR